MEDRDIKQEISAAFDSVNLINSGEFDEETIQRNIAHLKIKMNDIYFYESLSNGDKEIISNLIK